MAQSYLRNRPSVAGVQVMAKSVASDMGNSSAFIRFPTTPPYTSTPTPISPEDEVDDMQMDSSNIDLPPPLPECFDDQAVDKCTVQRRQSPLGKYSDKVTEPEV
ncbi:predicted protein [Histoplasma capsulatum G186AR]|uniref:Uncharacterized protein n=1 Tax=Ajellomyces capsulatus (strain G186AR / H82 / ATCC MYA-2454 / RMSCC 2432) TaxID=447093 RepID=C0NNI5_AJECG|nr:uncharacterized protein HCBG_04715 [Histoplasma capsulatum G186AR]EEH06495.1 predicted protein [Histoplasma capsulatum G186AR]